MQSMNLHTLIHQICRGNFNHSELLEFISISQKIAVSYLKYQEITGKNISLDKRGSQSNLEDVAMDCIATLFMRDDNNQFLQLSKYFYDVLNSPSILDDETILIKLRGLVIKKTKQELSRIFRERDPEGAKILRNVRVALKNAPDLNSFREMGREFVFSEMLAQSADYQPEVVLMKNRHFVLSMNRMRTEPIEIQYPNLRRHLPVIPDRILKQQFLILYSPRDPVSAIIRKMLMVVANYPEYQNYLGLDVIVNLIRSINKEMLHERFLSDAESESPMDRLRLQEIDQAITEAIIYIEKKIYQQYVYKNKIPSPKADIYLATITDYISDLASGKNTDSNFSYLCRHLPGLTQRQYRDEERSIFEYLVKLAKNKLIKRLQTLL
ncbi:hypothetical protein JW964_11085 [candidate division KSB1 bacterium]|nr:hypothetical protein [candidate division KSB1 bacterium]